MRISVVANVCLAGLALWLWRLAWIDGVSPSDRPTASSEREASALVPERDGQVIPRMAPAANRPMFQWRQIESSDYPTYIANLRAVGCPEQTIRDIITADVDSIYAPRRAQLKQEPDHETLQTKLQQLQNEEAGLLAALLGQSVPGAADAFGSISAATAPPPVRRSRFSSFPNNTGLIPIVFQDPGPEMELDRDQIEVIDDLRASFRDALTGLDRDSSEYRQRWQEAKRDADQRMCALLGYSFWIEYQVAAKKQQQTAFLTGQ